MQIEGEVNWKLINRMYLFVNFKTTISINGVCVCEKFKNVWRIII